MPIKSFDKTATDVIFGSSEILIAGEPDIGKSRPFDTLITFCVPY